MTLTKIWIKKPARFIILSLQTYLRRVCRKFTEKHYLLSSNLKSYKNQFHVIHVRILKHNILQFTTIVNNRIKLSDLNLLVKKMTEKVVPVK